MLTNTQIGGIGLFKVSAHMSICQYDTETSQLYCFIERKLFCRLKKDFYDIFMAGNAFFFLKAAKASQSICNHVNCVLSFIST